MFRSASALLLTLVALQFATRLSAEEPSGPPIIATGFNAYKTEGPQAAVKAWLKGSPLEEDKEAINNANRTLNEMHDLFRPYKSFDIIERHRMTPSIEMLYVAINYERAPMFGKFLVFRRADSWIVTTFTFNTNADKVLPASLLSH
jgi:hypothetical protein